MVESQPSKLLVAGSIPVSRSSLRPERFEGLRLAGQLSHCTTQVAFGRLVGRSARRCAASAEADVAQLAERVLGKDEVTSSILVIGSSLRSHYWRASFGSVDGCEGSF